MNLHHGDCLDVMAGMDPESVDAIVTDPPYGLEFMGKEWDRLGNRGQVKHDGPTAVAGGERGQYGKVSFYGSANRKCRTCGHWEWSGTPCRCDRPDFETHQLPQARLMQEWHARWAEAAYRVAKPSAYLLAFGGTRTVHRMTVALEDAGWIIRDMLVWAYASGFPKSKASLKPAWEPIVMARKPGPLRMLAIDECRIPVDPNDPVNGAVWTKRDPGPGRADFNSFKDGTRLIADTGERGRWPANVILTDPIFDGGVEGVVGGGWQSGGGNPQQRIAEPGNGGTMGDGWPGGMTGLEPTDTSGTYSRFFLIPKADRSDREPVLGHKHHWVLRKYEDPPMEEWRCDGCGAVGEGTFRLNLGGRDVKGAHGDWDEVAKRWITKPRENNHPTVKPTDLMRHLVRLVTPTGGTVLDPFLGSGSTALAAEMEGFEWIGIEREADYIAIAEARLNGVQRGLGLDVPAPTPTTPNTHPDLSKHQPKQRAPGDNWSGHWSGTPEEEPA